MKKKIAIMTAALLILTAAAGCGKKADNTNTAANTAKTEQTDASGAYEVDMEKIDGDALKSDSDTAEYDGEIGDAEIKIGDVKVINYMDADVAVVSFEYKNKGADDMPFTGAVKAEAYQDDNHLAPTVVSDVEGVNMLSLSENVKKGDSITVQKAYILDDKITPLTIEVVPVFAEQTDAEPLTKTFTF